jgi:hypothetical protein
MRDMNVFGRVLAVLSLGLLMSCGDGSRSAGPKGIGEVDVVVRVVRGTLVNYDQARLLAVDDAVYWRERIETEKDSATQMEFADGTRLSVGPDARVVLDEFVYGGPAGTDRMVLTVTKGISRFITGNMDKAAYEIRAPGAIIGVRGTDFTLVVDPDQGATTCLVHHGEVSLRRSDGGAPVIIKPGEASKVVVRDAAAILPPASPAPDVIREADRLQNVIREARQQAREQERHVREAAVSQPTGDRRLSALQAPREGRDRLSDLVEQVRTASGSEGSGRGQAAAGTVGGTASAAAASALPRPATSVAPPQALGNLQAPTSTPTPTPTPVVGGAGHTSAPTEPPASIGGVPLPAAKGLCSGGASCLAEPPPNRVTSPTRM